MLAEIPITVIGGYLGAGKTTLLNSLLGQSNGLRIGVVVNDFGDLGIDADLISEGLDGGDVPVVNLANGCVCCTLGDDLRSTLETLAAMRPLLDHIVIEVSGVADPAATAAWGTVAPFVPGGTLVLAAADSVRRSARHRYIGREVLLQIAAADLVVLTKTDLVDDGEIASVTEWLTEISSAPVVEASMGALPLQAALGAPARPRTVERPDGVRTSPSDHEDGYVRWSWRPVGPVTADGLDRFLSDLPQEVLRLKGLLQVVAEGGSVTHRLVQVVGRSATVTAVAESKLIGLEAIGARGALAALDLDGSALKYLHSP